HFLISTHIAENTDGTDNFAIGIAQRGSIECRWNDLARGAARVKSRITCNTALDNLTQGGQELTRFLRADKARQGLLQYLVWEEAEQRVNGIVGLLDLAFQV